VTARFVWGGISLGVFFIALGVIIARGWGENFQWLFVVMAGMSLVNAIVKGRWRFAPHPLLWAAGLGWAYATGYNGWAMFWYLCGASVILGFLIGLIPRSPPPPPPAARPGAGVVIDV
jgi:hypothetical protein